MADTPSLGEILSVKGDADLAYGTQGVGGTDVQFDFNKGLSFLADAAKSQAEANRFKVETWQRNLEDFYKNFNTLSVDGVMEKDMPDITNEYAQLTADMAANYDIIRNPNKDLQRWGELKQREATLRGKIAQSKQDVGYRDHFNKLIATSPNLNTEANRRIIEDFNSKKLGERTYGTLATPYAYNPKTYADAARAAATTEIKAVTERKGGQWLDTVEGKKVVRDIYMKYWRTAHSGQDELGRPAFEASMDAYKKSGSSLPYEQWLEAMGEGLMGVESISTTTSQVANPYGLQHDQQAFTAGENAKDRALQREQMNQRAAEFNKTFNAQYGTKPDKEKMGEWKEQAWTLLHLTGNIDQRIAQNSFGDNTEVETVKKVASPDNPNSYTEVKEKKPALEVVATKLNEKGQVEVTLKNNRTGVTAPSRVLSTADTYTAMNKMFSDQKVSPMEVSESSRVWRKNVAGVDNPDLNVYQRVFNLDGKGNFSTSNKKNLDERVNNSTGKGGKNLDQRVKK